MSTFRDRKETALVVVDAQTGVLSSCHDRDAVVDRINDLVTSAREAGAPVVWVQHCSDEFPAGSDVWQVTAELQPEQSEPRVLKRYGDSFEDTTLEAELAKLDAGKIIVCGAMTDACIRCTIHGGLARGYDVTLVSDAHTTEDMRQWGSPIGPEEAIAYLNMAWSHTSAPGRDVEVIAAAAIDFACPAT
ncbi:MULTISPECIES: isochorismatase family protein [Dermabacter]|uniref:isochorismatase family protein n=1 Tax=Dermabacter TaxID=36739 RepID=UPI0008A654EB|nr:isochorismatase family protein [Dermabacter sp. HMSC08H10]MCT1709431.1 isochorismatase family protein [Dermabacter hominis]OFT21513.1 isochorismatase [Dermabacter sp. HMSC08H10]